MTDRDHFAAAALTGLLSQCAAEDREAAETAAAAMRYADAMLRERGNHSETPNSSPNLDAAPAARVPEPEPSAARRRPAGGTGDTDHGAAPAARASVGRPRTDNADLPICAGTGDTPDSPQPIKGGVSDRSKPITGPDPDSRVWETHTPATHATPSVGSVPRDGTEPVAWGVANGSRVLATSISRMDAVDMQGDYAYHTEIVPLYREPTLTDAEREALERTSIAYELLPTEGAQQVSATLRGLLGRLGGGE